MVKEQPIVTLQVRFMQEQMAAAVMLRRDEIADEINAGLERALHSAPDAIVEAATEEAGKAIRQQVENYFRYGAGYQAIKAAIETALAPLTEALTKQEKRK